MWREAIMAQFEILHPYWHGGTEEDNENLRIAGIRAEI
jgi:hypothetical protein